MWHATNNGNKETSFSNGHDIVEDGPPILEYIVQYTHMSGRQL